MKITTRFFSLAIAAAMCLTTSFASAATLANWTFEAPNTPADVTNNVAITGVLPATGTGTASGLHASANTDWTTPSGNGSAESLSANEYAIGDYFQFQTPRAGATDFTITWDQTGSATGPRDWKLQYSTDGSIFTDLLASYTVLVNGAPNPSWAASGVGLPSSAYTFSASIAGVPASTDIYFRMSVTSGTAINGSPIGTGGTGRVDNVNVVDAVPEPSTFVLAGMAVVGLVGVARRRKSA
jgi:hypothetical protein